MKQTLGLRMGQSLTMTPALQQAIRLLQLSSLDLQQEIQQALDGNLMLEADSENPLETSEPVAETVDEVPEVEDESTREVGGETTIPDDMPVDAQWDDVYDSSTAPSSGTGNGKDDDGLQDYLQANLHSSVTLREHLLWQAGLAPFDATEAAIAAHLIDSIDDEGYLKNFAEVAQELCASLNTTPEQVEAALRKVQDFDPTGVAARDLSECLRLQLLQYPAATPGRPTALKLIAEHVAMLAGKRDAAAMAAAADLPLAAVEQALALIQSLQPYPGRPYQAHESNYVAPDVYVAKRNGRWRVSLNPEHQPKLRVNTYYQSMIKRADTSRDQLTMKNHLQEARYFINALEARNETLLRVAQCIVEEQRAFLEYGEEAMRPLVLRDVSEQLGIHESTVSRATANKYMLTPRGLFELKYFFSSHVSTTAGGVASATAIQAMIKRLIAGEDPVKPLSDSTLAEVLLKEGIQVARRTVAKYREGLNIPPSHERKPSATSRL